jgi:hypothetical protein
MSFPGNSALQREHAQQDGSPTQKENYRENEGSDSAFEPPNRYKVAKKGEYDAACSDVDCRPP